MGPGKFFVFLLEQPKTFPSSIFHPFLLFGCWVVKIPIVLGSITHTNVIKCLPTGLKRAFLPNPQYSAHLSTSQHFSTVFEAPGCEVRKVFAHHTAVSGPRRLVRKQKVSRGTRSIHHVGSAIAAPAQAAPAYVHPR